jgi:hypothetical protein
MTPSQIELARHALGLDGKRKMSYRNRFCAGIGHPDLADWCDMVAAGYAVASVPQKSLGGDRMFWLTLDSATLALRPGEHLDPEDFPAARHQGSRQVIEAQHVPPGVIFYTSDLIDGERRRTFWRRESDADADASRLRNPSIWCSTTLLRLTQYRADRSICAHIRVKHPVRNFTAKRTPVHLLKGAS